MEYNNRIGFTLTAEQYAELSAAAGAVGLMVGSWVRMVALAAARAAKEKEQS